MPARRVRPPIATPTAATAPVGAPERPTAMGRAAGWTFLTNHSHVLLCVAADPEARLRDVAARVGITERAVQHIVSDLESGGAITRERVGRRNRYAVHPDTRLRHPVEAAHTVRELLALGPRTPDQTAP